jgi:ankyrin repeat protein
MSTPLPARPSLDWLRKRAKATLKQLRTARPSARLADAQLALAREHGFRSWRALKAEVDARRATPAEPAAPLDQELVARFLQLVGAGDLGPIRQLLARHPSLVNATGPHPFWGGRPQPLHVAIETGRQPVVDLLLRAGADPNGSNAEYSHWSPLMLAIGRRPGIQRALLRRGARIGLVEALMKGDDRTVTRLLKRGASALPPAPNDGSLLMFARTPKAIDRLIELGVSTETRDRWGASPIEALSRLGRVGRPLVRHLQSKGVRAEPAEFARMGDRAALSAVAKGNPDVLRDPAVMMGAVDFKHHALVRWLLAHGADPNARATAQSQHTALHSAAWNGDLTMVKLLVAAGADPGLRDRQYDATPQGWAETSIEITSNEKCIEVAEWLAARARRTSAPPPEERPARRVEWKPLMDAAFNGDPVLVERLLRRGADPNVLSNSTQRHRPLHRVIERKKTLPKHRGHEQVLRLLLTAGADPCRRALLSRMTALALAATDGPQFVPILLPYAGELDLFHAAVTLDAGRVAQLLDTHPESARAADSNTLTPLHYCAASAMFALSDRHQQAQLDIARALLSAGAGVNELQAYAGHWSITPLYYAAGYQDNPVMTEFLLDAGADPADGESIYHASDEGHARALGVFARRVPGPVLAAEATGALTGQLRWGGTRGAPWLLAHGADPNAINPTTGDAALHAAARVGAGAALIKVLLSYGARTDLRNRDGQTAREVGRKAGNMKLAALLA